MNLIQAIDNNIILYIHSFMLNNEFYQSTFEKITVLGDGGFIWALIGIILLIKKSTRKIGIIMLISLFIGNMFGNSFLKRLIRRPRPFVSLNITPFINPPNGFSFPSGHSMSSFIGATNIFLWNKKIGIGAYILASLIAISRVILCVHYPTDILAGSILGILVSILLYDILNNYIINPTIN